MSCTGSAVTLAITGTAGAVSVTAARAVGQAVGGRLHQGAMERGRNLEHHAAPRAALLGQGDRALDRGGRARDDLLALAIVVGELAHAARGGGLRDHGLDRRHVGTEDGRHGTLARRDRVLHRLAAQAQQPRRIADADRTGRGQCRILAEAVAGDVVDQGRTSLRPVRSSTARTAASEVAIRAGWALAVSVRRSAGPSKISGGERLAQRLVDLVEHGARGRARRRRAPGPCPRPGHPALGTRRSWSSTERRPRLRCGRS